ncbi:MAG TPA: tripartite tricarboxylate transporter substrate binding protein [Chloroflexota bacterium]|nr:tripartite tricarboxylate transporter substrate binding protein [Chloroflexota bacterium]
MKYLLTFLAASILGVTLLLSGCSQAAPAPTAAPTKPAESTKAPAAQTTAAPQPTAASTAKVDFPQKGKTITLISPWTPGGSTSVGLRLLAPLLEKELGVQVQVVDKPGAGSQVGLTEAARAKPDGYTIAGANLPAIQAIYLDPERKSAFTRKDFDLVALMVQDPGAVGVKADSPIKSVKDLVDMAKAKPDQVKGAATGIWGLGDLAMYELERATKAKIAHVQFDGSASSMAALMGGHVDSQWGTVGDFLTYVQSGQIRLIGVMDKKESEFAPGVKTFEAQGYNVVLGSSRGIVIPAGTPKEITAKLSAAVKKAMQDPELKKKMSDMSLPLSYMTPEEFGAHWGEMDTMTKELMSAAKKN